MVAAMLVVVMDIVNKAVALINSSYSVIGCEEFFLRCC